MKTPHKTFVLIVKIKGKKAPDLGMGKGILGYQEIDFADNRRRGFNNPMFELAKREYQDRLADSMLTYEWVEKKDFKKWKRNLSK